MMENTRHDDARSEAVYKATLAIATELSIDASLQKIVDSARELVRAEFGALGVVDEEHRRLSQFVVSGIPDEQIRAIGSWPRGLGLLGELIHFPRPLRVRDVSSDPRSVGVPPHHPPVKSFLGVPIIRSGRVLGNLYMTNKLGAEEFSAEDEELLSLFATHAAIAIENARLYTETDIQLKAKVTETERAGRRASFLADLGAALLQLAPGEDPALEPIAERVTELLGDGAAICLVNPATGTQSALALYHSLPSRHRAAQAVVDRWWNALIERVVLARQALLVSEDVDEDETAALDLDVLRGGGFSAALAVPIATRESPEGFFLSLASRPLTFTRDDVRFAALTADRLASALHAARLHRMERESRAQAQALAELAQRRASELETILDTMAEAVYVIDSGMRIVRMNRTYAQMVGLDEGKQTVSIEEHIERVNPRDENGRSLSRDELPMVRALRGETFTNQLVLITPMGGSGDRFLSVSGSPIRDPSGEILAAVNVARDVTESKEMDRMKDEFISVASHELKTPLTVAKGYSQILLQRLEKSGSAEARIARQILDQTNRMADLADRLLDVSRVQFGRLQLEQEEVELAALVRRVVEQMRVSFQNRPVTLSLQEPVRSHLDPGRIEQVVSNLLSNAAKYSPEGSEIDVSLECRDGESVISVRDRGHGIPVDQQPRIFQRFYRASSGRGRSGTGLGLYVSKGIVEAHGGRIWFESREGEGSTFYVSLPVEQ